MTQAGALTISRDSQNGRVTGTTLGGVTDAYTYDANGALASYVAQYSGATLYSEIIGARDGDGRITQRTESVGSVTHDWMYQYDAAGRLTDVTEDGSLVSSYGYDNDDNRTTFMNTSGSVFATYDAQDRLLTYGGAAYTYGANGELQGKTDGGEATNYAYDVFGNLLNATLPNGTALAYVIDGQNRRVGKQVNGALTTGFLYQDQLNTVAQLDGNGNVVSRFVFGSKPNVPDYYTTSAGTFRILSDHLGSPRLVVNTANGSVVEEIDYHEFGNVTNDTAPGTIPFGFAGGLYDQNTGLVRFGARDYDPSTGRWTSKDPIRFQGGMNLYGYAMNDPVDFRDTTGRSPDRACVNSCKSDMRNGLNACLGAAEGTFIGCFTACLGAAVIANPTPAAGAFCAEFCGQGSATAGIACVAVEAGKFLKCVYDCPSSTSCGSNDTAN